MRLSDIQAPEDLRGMSYEELDDLAGEIRQFIVDAIDRRGSGHLGSNLGAVELTLALHRVFSSPDDILLWDIGHLAYVHKMLTGRQAGFDQLRRAGGMSGYPSWEESAHDWVENSHASTILSYAHGLATAQESPTGDDRRVVAVIGDGGMTGGMAYEGLNNLGHSGRKAIIVLNDNGRSYAPTVSRLADSVARLRANPQYLRQRARVERLVRDVPMVGDHLAWGMSGAIAGVRELFEPPVFFESLGVRYIGPLDGHDVEGLERALRHADAYDGPIVVHVLTQKGRGYGPAEDDPVKCLHDIGSPKPRDQDYTAAFTESLISEAESRPEVVALTAAMPDSTGLLPFAERFPDRMIDVGIAEQHLMTSASGMAMGGLRPVVAVYSTFLSRGFDQLNLDVGLHGQPAVFCVDRAGITGDDGPSHHGVLDMVLTTKVPGMTVFAPSSYQEVGVMLHDALEITTGPCALRWPKTPAPSVGDDEVGHGLSARLVRAGDAVCVIGVGKMLAAAQDAAALLAGDGIEATVWDPRVVKPLDPAMIADAGGFDLVVTVEDGLVEGGIGTQVASAISEGLIGTGDRPPLVRTLGIPTRYLPHGKADQILADLGLDGEGVAAEVRRCLGAPSGVLT